MYIFISIIIFLGIILFIMNFMQILKFKWYIDFFNMNENICKSRYEIESMRYNLYTFLYNIHEDHFKNIYEIYKITYFTFITYFTLVCVSLFAYMYINGYTFYNISLFIVYIIYVVYTTVNGILMDKYNELYKNLNDSNSYLYRYSIIYKILNAIMSISNLKDATLTYNLDKLNSKENLDEAIEKNIGSYYNVSNISKIKNLKVIAYEKHDFVKYLVLDKNSPYFLKYFNNIYIRLPEKSTNSFDISENIYINDIYLKRQSVVDYDEIHKTFNEINDKIIEQNAYNENMYGVMFDKIKDEYPKYTIDRNIFYKKLYDLYNETSNMFYSNKKIEEYNKILYDFVKNSFDTIQTLLNVHNINDEYQRINDLIHEKINKELFFSVPNADYIEYFINNKDVLFEDNESYNSTLNKIYDITKYIYAYLVYFIFIFLLFSHYIYININNELYSYVILSLLIICLSILWIYTNGTIFNY